MQTLSWDTAVVMIILVFAACFHLSFLRKNQSSAFSHL